MTRYRMPVADELLEQFDAPGYWDPVEDFRLVSIDGPRPGIPYQTICTVEDDNAPAELEGALVEPTFKATNYSRVWISDRRVIEEPVLSSLLGKRVTVRGPYDQWTGELIAISLSPAVLIERADGFRVMLPQTYDIQLAPEGD